MATSPECKFYVKGGKCSHKDAPNPNHSYCIGEDDCGVCDDNIERKVDEPQETIS